ncbi:hypothetical protein KHS38_04480 [Mucilaginibacter sp. Bleaf8]|uniref:YMGG-like glycine zipper-containing protein n=1 Tax=Mucilaginibacter sp. Bleaf8 TaxID=2834430 RepID=UPI001BD18196|nr:YMGG-like glycine zipper-containing protein [Mucilaginibacter sp. Bleaf8]MBS7563653.1 hypothetical protein [Mucilaginibacter sp. Bleaf8]
MKKTILLFSLIITVLLSSTTYTNAQRKRGMSDQAKGALIGGAGGAVAGGLIGKGVKGALIGGAIGAGGGYIIGNEHRRNKAKRQRAYYRTHKRSTYYSRRKY